MRLSGHSPRQKGFTRSRRTHQKRSLRKLRADPRIFLGIMEKVHDLHQRLLGFVLAGHIRKGYAGLLLHIHLRIAFSDSHNPISAAHAVEHEI